MMYCTCTVYIHVVHEIGTYTLPIPIFPLLLNMYIVGLNSTVILLSNDKNLLNKARVCKITAFDRFVSISENKRFKGKKPIIVVFKFNTFTTGILVVSFLFSVIAVIKWNKISADKTSLHDRTE